MKLNLARVQVQELGCMIVSELAWGSDEHQAAHARSGGELEHMLRSAALHAACAIHAAP